MPARYRFAYLPRTPPFIDAKSYSERMPFMVFRLTFFIESSFVARSAPRSDDPDQYTLYRGRCAEGHLLHLGSRMSFEAVGYQQFREWVATVNAFLTVGFYHARYFRQN